MPGDKFRKELTKPDQDREITIQKESKILIAPLPDGYVPS